MDINEGAVSCLKFKIYEHRALVSREICIWRHKCTDYVSEISSTDHDEDVLIHKGSLTECIDTTFIFFNILQVKIRKIKLDVQPDFDSLHIETYTIEHNNNWKVWMKMCIDHAMMSNDFVIMSN